jgi:hypothetical protein
VSAQGRAYVRDADPEDAEQIAIIHVHSWQAAYRGLLPQEYLDRLDPAIVSHDGGAGWPTRTGPPPGCWSR